MLFHAIDVEDDPTLHLPRVLCLHGGGSNARIFRAQCRKFSQRLQSHFRLVFVEAPFLSQAGPCVLSVYSTWGPFKRWLPWAPGDPHTEPTASAIDDAIQHAMDEDDAKGATGEWVSLMGFSQGAKVCASLLFRQQVLVDQGRQTLATPAWVAKENFRFAVLLAGRGPLLWMEPGQDPARPLEAHHASSTMTAGWTDHHSTLMVNYKWENTLRLPTIHVHGLQDPDIDLHRLLFERCCQRETARLVEWDGDHRVPLKPRDVEAVVDRIFEIARQTGILQ
ncbi:hypothetical protein CDV55_101173 [Aspergillus turcosus]|uniref:Serine hydrolase domain-containing protein n=1 Tax=Aspergillus turcosus TaxID=1245748 RepID=A0A229WW81_9EURO|nr:hypothetical protein CDV55_101173 [Aspergillus turcosus]RLL93236.1 hypothetical protein CFD26_100722 [Aspergillus turcosus]